MKDNLIPLHYEIHFDGNINLLKSELDNLDLVVDYTNYVSVAMLNTTEFALDKPKLSPNPFSNTFDIQTNEVILNYSLFDISGKELINTNSKMALDDLSLQLNAGVYFLNLQLENGQKSNYKIVKK